MNTRQVMTLSGATARQLQWWDERGIVVPTIYAHERYYTAEQATAAMVAMDLKRKGLSLKRVKHALQVVTREQQVGYLVVQPATGRARGAFDEQEVCKIASATAGPVIVLPIRRHYENGDLPGLKKFRPKQSRSNRPRYVAPENRGQLTKTEREMTAIALGMGASRDEEETRFSRALSARNRLSIDGQ